MVTVTSQGDLPGTGGKSQKSFIGRTLRRAGLPTFQGELRGGFGGARTALLGMGGLLVGSPQNCPQLGGRRGFGGGSVAPPCAWPAVPRIWSGNRARIRPQNLHLEQLGGQVRPLDRDLPQDESGMPLLPNSIGIQLPGRLQVGPLAPDPRSQRRWDPPIREFHRNFLPTESGGGIPQSRSQGRRRWDPPAPEPP